MTSFDAFEEEQDRLHKERIDSIRAGGRPGEPVSPPQEAAEGEETPADPTETPQDSSERRDSEEIVEKDEPSAEVSEEKDNESTSESDFTDEGGDE